MKKLLAIVLATVMVVSMFAVSASAFMDVTENFDRLPTDLEGREDVTLQTNKALKISFMDQPEGRVWGYKGMATFSDELITYNSTVSFYFKTNAYPDGWCYRLNLTLTDALGKLDESETMGGITTNGNIGRTPGARSLGYITYDAEADIPGSKQIYPNATADEKFDETAGTFVEIVADTWYRIDMLVDFDTKTTGIYVNGELYATANHSPNAVGYKGLKSCMLSSGNFAQDFYVDELVVREGLIAPEDDDIIAAQDRDAIEAAEEVKIYEPYDALNENTRSNTNLVPWTCAEIDGFNQSTLSINVPHADNAFDDVYLSLNEAGLEGNATVSFKMMTAYTVRKLPGLKINLVNADKEVLGGFIVGADAAKLMFDDGEHVYSVKDADDADIKFSAGAWYQIDLLLNHANHSLTLYINGTRIGTVALNNAELASFTGVMLSKQATTGTKAQTYTFDNLKAVEGLYAPGAAEALAADDALVQIDIKYVEPVATTTKAPETTKTPETTDAPNVTDAPDVTDAPTTEAPKAEGGCGGVSLGAVIALAVGMFGIGFTVIKKK